MKKYTVLNWLCIVITIITLNAHAQSISLNESNETNGSMGSDTLPVIGTDPVRKSGALLLQSEGFTYTYEKKGKVWNLKTMTGKDVVFTYAYNAKNQLIGIIGGPIRSVIEYDGEKLKRHRDYTKEGILFHDITVQEWQGVYPVKLTNKHYNPKDGRLTSVSTSVSTIENNRVTKIVTQSSKGQSVQTRSYVKVENDKEGTMNDPQVYTGYDPVIEPDIALHGLIKELVFTDEGTVVTQSYTYEYNKKGLVSKKTMNSSSGSTHVTTYEYSYDNY